MEQLKNRKLKEVIRSWLFQNFILILYGARQVGKTTLVQEILEEYPDNQKLYLNCDDFDIREKLKPQNATALESLIGKPKILVIDEAQRVEDIGITLKILFDNNPEMQIIATGSRSFDVANKINEPLTGRSLCFKLYPFSLDEASSNALEMERNIHRIMTYGSYPKIFLTPELRVEKVLNELCNQYLYKDLLNIEGVKKADILIKLLKALAYQLGQEVSYTELADLLHIDKKSVEKYINILEQSFVIFRLNPFSRNLRNELKKLRKIYFYDLGMRNSLIDNFQDIELRPDKGAIWENFCICEFLKKYEYQERKVQQFFWRTHEQKEIDLVEEEKNQLRAFEFKYKKPKKFKSPKEFLDSYKVEDIKVIYPDNFVAKYNEL